MEDYRIVDPSLPIVNGGGFGRPAQTTYSDHSSRGKPLLINWALTLMILITKQTPWRNLAS